MNGQSKKKGRVIWTELSDEEALKKFGQSMIIVGGTSTSSSKRSKNTRQNPSLKKPRQAS